MVTVAVWQLERRLAPLERGSVRGLEHGPGLLREELANRRSLAVSGREPDRPQAAAGRERVPETPVEEEKRAVRKRLGGEARVPVAAGRAPGGAEAADREPGGERGDGGEHEDNHSTACSCEDGRGSSFSGE
jgi:hypothetical protein